MKIPSLQIKTPTPTDPAQPAAAAPQRPTDSASPMAGSTQVAFSPVSSILGGADGDVDMARVEAIRNAIRNGELAIDASRIADGLIENARELLGR